MRERQDGGREVGDGELAHGGVAHAHRDGDQRDHRVGGERADPDGGERGEDGGAAEQPRLERERDAEVAGGGCGESGDEAPAGARAEEEGGKRDERGEHGQPAGVGEPEAEQHDVAGHVGGEDVAKAEVADGVDEPGGNGQREQRGREAAVVGCWCCRRLLCTWGLGSGRVGQVHSGPL